MEGCDSVYLAKAMRRKTSFKKNWLGYVLTAPAVIVIIFVAVYPMLYGISFSFFEYDLLDGVDTVRPFAGLSNYIQIFSDPAFLQALRNTVVWTVANVVAQIVLATIIALVLNEVGRGRSFFRTSVLIPWAIPSVIAVLAFRFLYDANVGIFSTILMELGITEGPFSFLGNISTAMPSVIFQSIWKGIPFVLIFILAALQSIPLDIYESAYLDGASRWQKFWYITLPSIKDTVGIAAILTTIGTINNFNTIWLSTQGGPLGSTEILYTLAYRRAFVEYNFGIASAISTVIFIIIFILTLIYIRFTETKEG